MSAETEFVEGLIAKPPHDSAPDFVKAKLSIKREELIAWLQGRDGEWVNADIKVSRNGKWYVAVDPWKPEPRGQRQASPRQQPASDPNDPFGDSIPF